MHFWCQESMRHTDFVMYDSVTHTNLLKQLHAVSFWQAAQDCCLLIMSML